MNRPHSRQIYLLIIIGIFCLITPIIYRYSRGERFDWESRRFVNTGILSIVSDPKKSQIALNGHWENKQTPAKLIGLLPGRYQVVIAHAGYATWTKELVISPGQTTFAEQIHLLRQSPDLAVIHAGKFDAAQLSPNGQELIVAQPGASGAMLRRFQNDTLELLKSLTLDTAEAINDVSFSPSGKKIFVRTASRSWLAQSDLSAQPIALNNQFIDSNYKFYWSRSNENELFIVTGGKLFLLDAYRNDFTSLITTGIEDLAYINDRWFAITTSEEGQFLAAGTSPDKLEMFARLPAGQWNFMADPGEVIRVHSTVDEILSFTQDGRRLDDPTFRQLSVPAGINWSSDKKMFVFIRGNEVWAGQREVTERLLIGRFSTPPTQVGFVLDDSSVLLTYPDRLEIMELDQRDHPYQEVVYRSSDSFRVLGYQEKNRAVFIAVQGAQPRIVRLAVE